MYVNATMKTYQVLAMNQPSNAYIRQYSDQHFYTEFKIIFT